MEERVSTPDYAPPAWLLAELRAAHAGEAGNAMLCRGILAVTRDVAMIDGARRQSRAADNHRETLEGMLPPEAHSRLLWLLRGAAWLAGVLPALAGAGAVQATRAASAGVMERCYGRQIRRLRDAGTFPVLRAVLEHCRDETAACAAGAGTPGFASRRWAGLVGAGTAAAMALARRF